ncbi:MAG: galactose mutarotase [Planctomycetes bacterium]|nr:galactose mutarotase [Planctomycetota bacterium]
MAIRSQFAVGRSQIVLAALGCILSMVPIWQTAAAAGKLGVQEKPFGQTTDGQTVAIFELTNANGLRARVMEYGAILVSLEVPNRDGKLVDVALGFDDLAPYLRGHPLFGSTVGRYANRIAGARFVLDGVEYKLTANSGKNHIHGGGNKRFDKVVWQGQRLEGDGWVGVRFSHLSLNGEEGFPGNLECSVMYLLNNDNELQIRYGAITDKPTIVNLTNHSYFNLAGEGKGDVLGHEMMIDADFYTPAGEGLIPTGEIHTVKGTPLDFTQPQTIGARIAELTQTRGYDHCYVLAGRSEGGPPSNRGQDARATLAARVYEPTGGIVMEVRTTEPGVQLYTANGMKNIQGKGGKVYGNHYGFCLETQHFPDSPNKPHFPSTVLRPGQKFESTTIFRFSSK